VAFGILDLIDADRIDLAQHPVLQPEGDDLFHRVEDLVPGGARASAVSFNDSRRAQQAKKSI
jgi:hypothetical protein